MNYRMNLLFLIVAILPVIRCQPIEEQPKNVAPLAKSQEKDANDTSEETTTDGTYIEETYIEVLLPGIPQVNSSFLESLLNSSSSSSTTPQPITSSSSTEQTDDRVKREDNPKKTPLTSFQVGKDSTVSTPKSAITSKNPSRVARGVTDDNKATTQKSPSTTESVVYITPQQGGNSSPAKVAQPTYY